MWRWYWQLCCPPSPTHVQADLAPEIKAQGLRTWRPPGQSVCQPLIMPSDLAHNQRLDRDFFRTKLTFQNFKFNCDFLSFQNFGLNLNIFGSKLFAPLMACLIAENILRWTLLLAVITHLISHNDCYEVSNQIPSCSIIAGRCLFV